MATKADALERVRLQLPELVLVVTAGGFAITFAELVVTEHTGGTQVIAVIAAGLGLALCLMGLLARSRIILRPMVLALLLLSISGPVGVFLHASGEAEGSEASVPAAVDVLAGDEDDGEDDGEEDEGEEEEDGDSIPPLAPLGLSGLALLGAAGILARED